MEDEPIDYKKQHENVTKILKMLQKHKAEIEFQLLSDPSSSHLNKDLRTVDLEIKITVNEIEHIEYQMTTYQS